MAPARLWFVALALTNAIASVLGEGADETLLIQQSIGSHSQALEEQSPFGNIGDMLKGLPMPGAPSPGGGAAASPSSGFPSFPGFGGSQSPTFGMPGGTFTPPSAEDVAKGITAMKEVLRNDTLVNLMVEAMGTFRSVLKNSTQGLAERYKQLADSLVNMKQHKDVVRRTVEFVEGEVDAFEADIRIFIKTTVKLVKAMPLGNQSRQIKMMASMAEPLVMQGMASLKKSTADSLQALGNNTEKEFCKGTMPVVLNASTSVGPLRQAHVEVTKMVEGLPALQQSPLVFMMPDLVPKMIKIGKGVLDVNEATIEHYEAQALQLNTTLRSALEEKLDCVILLRSQSSRVSVGIVAVVASAVAWLLML